MSAVTVGWLTGYLKMREAHTASLKDQKVMTINGDWGNKEPASHPKGLYAQVATELGGMKPPVGKPWAGRRVRVRLIAT